MNNPKEFILAGNAIFTVKNNSTGRHFTYRVRKPNHNAPHFVSVLIGPNNTNDYMFIGTIFNEQEYRHGKKSKISEDAISARSFKWIWSHLDKLPDCIKIHHEGKCGACGRVLTTPESIERGIGPICASKI